MPTAEDTDTQLHANKPPLSPHRIIKTSDDAAFDTAIWNESGW